MKKILIIGHDASRTGAPRSLLNICKFLIENGFELHIVLGASGPLLNEFKSIGNTYVWRIDTSNYNLVQKALFIIKGKEKAYQNRIFDKVKKIKPNIIFNNTIVNGNILEVFSKLNVPIVSRVPELESVIQMFNKNGSADKVLKLSDKILAVSNSVKSNLVENHNINPDKIEVAYGYIKIDLNENKFSKEDYRLKYNIPTDAKIVGNCGSVIYRKGFDLFIQSAEILCDKRDDVYFIWLGGNKESAIFYEIKEDLKKRNLVNKVFFLGEIENVSSYYQNFDVFFLSSREEPFSLSMLEAAKFNVPIVAFDKSGGAEEFLQNGGGVLVEYGNVQAASQAIEKIIYNNEFQQSCKVKLKNKEVEFSKEDSQKIILNVINSLS